MKNLIFALFFLAGCGSIQESKNQVRKIASNDESINMACRNAANSGLRHYSADYIYSDCLLIVDNTEISSEQIKSCTNSTLLANSLFDCLVIIKESKKIRNITPELINACANLKTVFSFGFCLSEIAQYPEAYSVDNILSCKYSDPRTCLVKYRGKYLDENH